MMSTGRKRPLAMAVFIIAFGTLGLVLLLRTHAGTATSSIEPEHGSVSVTATTIADDSAAGGSAVRFGSRIRNIHDKGYGVPIGGFQWMTTAKQDSVLTDLKSLDISWIRIDIAWARVQPTDSTTYDWTAYDAALAKAASYGIKVDGIVDYSTPWANTAVCNTIPTNLCQPADINQYATYAKAVAQHFGSKLGAIELWNEPDLLQFWQPAVNPNYYTTMMIQAYTAIKSVDPGMLVMSGGLSPGNSINFTTAMYAMGGKNYFDVEAFHPYSYPKPPSATTVSSGWNLMGVTPNSNVRAIMATNGDSAKPTWITEVGAASGGPGAEASCADAVANNYPTGTDHVDECLQARIDSEAITVGRTYPWVGVIFLYTYQDSGTSTASRENFFGLLRYDGSHKPSYDAVKQAIANN